MTIQTSASEQTQLLRASEPHATYRRYLRSLALPAALLLLSACLSMDASAAPSKPDGLVGYWKLDEGIGAKAFDYSGGGAHGEILGDAKWETGENGPVLRFDGKTGYVSIPGGPWVTQAPLTLLCWYKPDSPTAGHVFNHIASGAIAGSFQLGAGGSFGTFAIPPLPDKGGKIDWKSWRGETLSLPAKPEEWNFVAIVIDKTEIRGYLNGEPVEIKQPDGQPSATALKIRGWSARGGGLSLGARESNHDNFYSGLIREMAVFDRALDAAEIAALHARYKDGQPLYLPAEDLKILGVQCQRSYYKPSESAELDLTIKNFSAKEQTATLVVGCVGRLSDWQEASRQTIKLKGFEIQYLKVAVPLKDQSFGCALEARLLRNDAVTDRGQAFIGVAENLWTVGIGGKLQGDFIGRATDKARDALLKSAREGYANWLEVYYWAPDDWGNLTPTADQWYSGQASYLMSPGKLKDFIKGAHDLGMKVVTYGKHVACGPDGAELARKKPEWFYPLNPGVKQLDEWNDEAARARKDTKFGWQSFSLDLNRVDTLDYGIKQIIDSAKLFGWDGIRYDGHYTVPSDAVSTWNMRRLKESVWESHPDFLLGFNYSWAPDTWPMITQEMKEAMAGGGMWMQEAIGHYGFSTDGRRYSNWTQGNSLVPAFAPNELKAAKDVAAMGGSYHCILGLENSPPPARVYKLVYSLIAGAHSVYGSHEGVGGGRNWGKFMTRWSAFLWHPRLKPVDKPESRIAVDKPGIYWAPITQEMVDTPTRKFTVIHLVNPSPDDSIKATTLPAPLDNVGLTIKPSPGAKIVGMTLVRPDSEPYAQDLKLEKLNSQGAYEINIPQIAIWAMVIVEESGNFSIPPEPPRFTNPVDEAELAAGRKAPPGVLMLDPLQQPTRGVTLQKNESLVETDTSYWSLNAKEASDPDANNGRAQIRRSGDKTANHGRPYNGPYRPGRYQFSVRLKLKDEQNPPRLQTVRISLEEIFYGKGIPHPNVLLSSDEKTPPERKLIIDGKYHYYDFDVDMNYNSLLHVWIVSTSADPEGNSLYCDHVIVRQLERYTDDQLVKLTPPPPKPEGLRAPEGQSPKKILHVRGQYWQLYNVEGQFKECTGAYGLPEKYEDLYNYDAVVMSDTSPPGKLEVRQMLNDFVNDGGRLVVLGGPWSLGLGTFPGTMLEKILPFEILKAQTTKEIIPCDPPLLLGTKPGKPYDDKPTLFWRHQVPLKQGAEVLAYAGDIPVAASTKSGKGSVAVFAGTVLGEEKKGELPFWKSKFWPILLNRMVAQ
jgi:hypothetical protein